MSDISKKIGISILLTAFIALIISGIVASATLATGTNNPTQTSETNTERTTTETKKETIPYETQTVEDDTVEYGQTVVRTEGAYGEKTITYEVTYKDNKEVSRKKIKEEITKQPVNKIIAKGTKIVWKCSDATSYDRNPNNDNYCKNSLGEGRYVSDCEAVALDPTYHPGQSGARKYNGCAR